MIRVHLEDTYQAKRVNTSLLGDKLRVNFQILDRDIAIKCFETFTAEQYINKEKDSLKIYLVKDEETFEKLADLAAADYELKKEERQKKA
jgi:hypothetical protein